MAENACMIAEVMREGIKNKAVNSGFARLSPHLASMLATRYGKLTKNVVNCFYYRQ
ncbi:hypothetical protein [Cellvibrio fibrivorans]|jgi:hypothetical protein|uniref:Uncharacterized protein n=1 Tax=Cellvibrio fibrivorans TaxID=126350 RepID=A0ABU1V3N7_9GAMM|nr:hypothetical protein [Cellvibrio fibrivorans]MDR7091918.1 hypothetical protein [Cellvibrio fibrivorans]